MASSTISISNASDTANFSANPTVQSQDQTCRLLALPAELRNRIYELALINEREITFAHWTDHPHCQHRRHYISPDQGYYSKVPGDATALSDAPCAVCDVGEYERPKVAQEPGLLRTCKVIRTEATQIFYGRNTFINPSHQNHRLWKRWLKHLHRHNKLPYITRVDLQSPVVINKDKSMQEIDQNRKPENAVRVLQRVHVWCELNHLRVPRGAIRVEIAMPNPYECCDGTHTGWCIGAPQYIYTANPMQEARMWRATHPYEENANVEPDDEWRGAFVGRQYLLQE